MTQTRSSSSDGPKHLPPDDELIKLAKTINDRLDSENIAGRVNFYQVELPEGRSEYAIIFQSGSKRAPVNLKHRPTEHDIPDIVRGMTAWTGARSGPLYTTELPEWDGPYA
jgi:hypothetical protein